MEFDMATWKVRLMTLSNQILLIYSPQRAIEVFNITEPMIPTRPKAQTGIGGTWYG